MSQLRQTWVIPVIVILVVLLAIESTLILFFIFGSSGGSQSFPGLVNRTVQAGCSTLTSSEVFSTAANRTVLFQCSSFGTSGPALVVHVACQSCPFDSNPYYEVYRTTPTFALPAGYLALWLTPSVCGSVSSPPPPAQVEGWDPLVSGQEIVVGGYYTSYNYCAVIDNAVSKPASFTINWSPGTPPLFRPAPFTLAASPTTMTIYSGETGNFTVTVTSVQGWAGTVNIYFSAGLDCCGVSPVSTIVRAGGSTATILSLPTCEYNGTICATLGSYPGVVIEGRTDCLSKVQGICFDQNSPTSFTVSVNVEKSGLGTSR